MVEFSIEFTAGATAMPMILTPPRRKLRSAPTPNRKRVTRVDCEILAKNGRLQGRYELIDGEIISKMGQKRPHALSVMFVTAWLIRIFGDRYVQCQLPIDVVEEDREINEPEPDVAVFDSPISDFPTDHPGPKNVLLIAQVSDTTLQFDLRNKARLYARSGIREYWVLDIIGRRLIVHRDPEGDSYRTVFECSAEETVSTLSLPDESVRVTEILPPA